MKVNIGVSARHVHLSKEDLDILFGKDYELTRRSDLSQPGQFASNEQVILEGPKGKIERVRILGPVRIDILNIFVINSKTIAIIITIIRPISYFYIE